MKPKAAAPKLSRQLHRVFSYWRQSVLDSRRMEISGREIAEYGVRVSFAAVVSGKIPPGVVESLFKKGTETPDSRQSDRNRGDRNQKSKSFKNKNAGALQIIIAPIRFKRTSDRGLNDDQSRNVEPLWIPAVIDRAGELTLSLTPFPWIPRAFLEPVARESTVAVGELDEVDEFFLERPPPRECRWNDYWRYCESFFRTVSGSPIDRWELKDYERQAEAVLVVDTFAGGGTTNIERMYNDILSGRRPAGLAGRLAEMKEPKRRLLAKGKWRSASRARRHYGQFGAKFSLSQSQRQAVHEVLGQKDGEILSVTGPPGTGKTTLIQSIVASLWISRARFSGLRPPVIVVCSATNQAVTNVIESFAKADSATDADPKINLLAGRWLPNVSSHATFCASFTKAAEAGSEQIELTDGTGFSAGMENWDYFSKAEEQFLTRFEPYGGKTKSVKRAVAHLQRELKREIAPIGRKIRAAVWGDVWNKLRGAPARPGSSENLAALFNQLDVVNRFRAFRIATHYWEGRWLIETARKLSNKELPAQDGKFSGLRSDWERRAMVTPCFVATFSTVARFFGRDREPTRPPIDLLIADEAGQVSTEIGAAPFSLAARGIVIGDTEQLEPVWNISSAIDLANLARHGLLKETDQKKYDEYLRAGLPASGGSLMKRAIKVCPVRDHSTIGVFLSEHRRSVKKIVEFANTLSYRGRLIPLRPEPPEPILPPFGYAHIRGICSVSGKSRINRIEAESIADWLEQNRSFIETRFGKSLDRVAAVLTPFVAQNRYLRSLLHRRYPKMTIGTVNSLQGAERPLVIFSPVYDQSENRRKIFDRSTNLINVAVTRAMDSFLVFGDMGIFDPIENTPSGILARFLFESPENEIVDIEPAAMSEMKESFERLSTLDQHREAVLRALRGAKREVTIVSPTVSIFAIRTDQLDREISEAVRRGIDVVIYTDENLDRDLTTGEVREPAKLGRDLLVQSGAKLFITKRIHNKAIAIDERELIEGSFNWLSAVRRHGSANQKLEVSVRYSGARAHEAIRALTHDLSERILEPLHKS